MIVSSFTKKFLYKNLVGSRPSLGGAIATIPTPLTVRRPHIFDPEGAAEGVSRGWAS